MNHARGTSSQRHRWRARRAMFKGTPVGLGVQFASPTLHALVTARRSSPSPSSQTFDIPVTRSQIGPSPPG